jgi:hypothetical protein
MTTSTRLGDVLTRLSFGSITSMALLALPIAGRDPAMAQNDGSAALTGTVSSPEEGKMEGVVVSAPYRRAEGHESRRTLQHVDRRPADEQDCPH